MWDHGDLKNYWAVVEAYHTQRISLPEDASPAEAERMVAFLPNGELKSKTWLSSRELDLRGVDELVLDDQEGEGRLGVEGLGVDTPTKACIWPVITEIRESVHDR